MERAFPRTNASLKGLFELAEQFLADERIDPTHLFAVQFALEEIFTNMVKYNPDGDGEIVVQLGRSGGELKMVLIDAAAEPFDLTARPPVRVDLPLEQRQPGGLGIHLTLKLIDEIRYEHKDGKSYVTMIMSLE